MESCAGPRWDKLSVADIVMETDLAVCRKQVEQIVTRRMVPLYEADSPLETKPAANTPMALVRQAEVEHTLAEGIAACMRVKGYATQKELSRPDGLIQ